MSAHEPTLAVNIRKDGVRYPIGTPISELPDLCRSDLQPFQVDGDLPVAEPEKPKRTRARAPKAPTEPAATDGAPAVSEGGDYRPDDDDEPF